MTTSYETLLAALPRGPEYDAEGRVLPFLDGPTELAYAVGEAGLLVGVWLNGTQVGSATSDADGLVTLGLRLDAGTHEIVLARPGGFASPLALEVVTVRRTATFHAAIGETFDDLAQARRRIELALTPWTADRSYLAVVYGVATGLANPAGWSTEAYRAALIALYEGLTQLGATPRGFDQVVAATSGAQPLVLPNAWLPGLDPSGSLLTRQPGAAGTTSDPLAPGAPLGGTVDGSELVFSRTPSLAPHAVLPNANGVANAAVHAAYSGATLAFPGPITEVPSGEARRMVVTFIGWDRGNVVISGRTADGLETTETHTGTTNGVVAGETYWIGDITATHSAAGTAGSASIGWRDARFAAWIPRTFEGIDTPALGGATVAFDVGDNTLAWNGGTPVTVPSDAREVELRGPSTPSHIFSLRDTANYDTQEANLVEITIDDGPQVRLDVPDGASTALTTQVTSINSALNGLPGYGASYSTFAAAVSAGALRLRNPAAPVVLGSESRIVLHGSAYARPDEGDWLYVVMGLPRAMSFLTAPYSGGTSATVVGAAALPDVPFDARIGRGRRADDTGFDLTALDAVTASIDIGVPTLPGDIGGWVFLTASVGGNTGIHRVVGIGPGANELTVVHETTGFVTDTDVTGTWVLYSRGERVTVTAVNTGTGVITLEAEAPEVVAAGVAYGDGSMLEVYDAVVAAYGEDDVGAITLAVDPALAPTGDTSDTLTLVGSDVPTGLAPTNATATLARGTYSARRAVLTAVGDADVVITGRLPGIGARLPGWQARAVAWVGAHTASRDAVWEWSYDGGATWATGTPVTVPMTYYAAGLGMAAPTQVAQTFEVPPPSETIDGEPADIWVRLVWVDALTADVFSLDEIIVEVVAHTNQWVVRNAREEDGTWWVYRWAPLTADPTVAVGMAAATETVMDTIAPAAIAVQPFEQDVRLGTYTLADWQAATLTNVAVVEVAPTELSYVGPEIDARVENERLALTTTAPYEATLMYPTDSAGGGVAGGDGDVLLARDPDAFDTPLPNDATLWNFQTAQTVRIEASEYDPDVAYLLRYRALVRATAVAIDLSTQADWEDYQWYFDAPMWRHLEPRVLSAPTFETLTISGDRVAYLMDVALTTRATLVRDDGHSQENVPAKDWEWVYSRKGAAPAASPIAGVGVAIGVRLSATAFNPDYRYVLTYVAASLGLEDVVDIDFEARSGADETAVGAATWVAISRGDPLPIARDATGAPASGWVQLRATWRPVSNAAADTALASKLWGLGARGVLLRGATPSAPAIV